MVLPLVVIASATSVTAQGSQPNLSRPFAPGTCGPADPTYIRTAEATGGIPFFFQRTEVAQATKFMMASAGENHVTVLWAKGTLQNSSRDFVVPIDSTLTNPIFVLSADNHETKMEVFDSGGTPISTSRQSDTTDFTCGRYLVTKELAAGDYRVHLTGTGRFWLSVQGKSDIYLFGVNFVEPGGRPGHEGMFPIHGQPLIGREAHLELQLSGPGKQLSFALRTPEDKSVRSIALKPIHTDKDSQELDGTFEPPAQPFRIVASGVDAKGHRFQRVHEAEVRPATIEILLHEMPDLGAGQTAAFAFQVRNLGDRDAFRVKVVCAKQWPVQADRPELALAKGENGNVIVNVSVPAETPPYTSTDLIVTVSSKSNPDVYNGFVQHLSLDH